MWRVQSWFAVYSFPYRPLPMTCWQRNFSMLHFFIRACWFSYTVIAIMAIKCSHWYGMYTAYRMQHHIIILVPAGTHIQPHTHTHARTHATWSCIRKFASTLINNNVAFARVVHNIPLSELFERANCGVHSESPCRTHMQKAGALQSHIWYERQTFKWNSCQIFVIVLVRREPNKTMRITLSIFPRTQIHVMQTSAGHVRVCVLLAWCILVRSVCDPART